MDVTPKLRQDITLGLKNGLSRETGLSGQIVKNSQAGGTFDFLRVREDKNRQAILFRLIQPAEAGGVAYFEFIPEKSADGKIRATDIYVFSSGEFLSEMLRRGVLPIIANENRTFLDKLLSGERDYISDLPKFTETAQLVSEGKMKEALALIHAMKPGTKKQKVVFLMRLRAAQAIDENEYAATLDEYRKLFPKDPGLDLLSISYYTTKKDFKQALECINRVESAVGGDPYLNVTRAALCDVQGKHDEAKQLARKAATEEPTLLPAYFELLGVSLIQKNHDETLAMLKEVDQKFQLKLNDLTKVREYADFVKSPQYKEWLLYRDQTGKKP
jgi:tetratricopeptide (TPR) repeat protein